MNLDELYKKYTGHLYVRRSDVRELVNFGLEEAAKVADENKCESYSGVSFCNRNKQIADSIRQLKTKE